MTSLLTAVRSRRPLLAIALLAGVLACLAVAAPAMAQTGSGWWSLSATAAPTNLAPGHEGVISVTATNLGDGEVQASEGDPVVLTYTLPEGVTAEGARPGSCPQPGISGVCTVHWPNRTEAATCSQSASKVTCIFTKPVLPYERLEVEIGVKVSGSAAAPTKASSTITISGGETPGREVNHLVSISEQPTAFGVEEYGLTAEDEAGAPESQAGAHPFQFTTNLNFTRILQSVRGTLEPEEPHLVKNLHVNLPAGLIGNADRSVIPQCTELQFTTIQPNGIINECPAESAIGAAVATLNEPNGVRFATVVVPVFNLVPSQEEPNASEDEPARFGFIAQHVPVLLDTSIRGGDYHVVVNVSNLSEEPALLGSTVTIWGVPGAASHDLERGNACIVGGREAEEGEKCEPPEKRNSSPFLTLPTSCEALRSTVGAESWLTGEISPEPFSAEAPQTLTGCEKLGFSPAISVKPTETQASTPTGLTAVLAVPQTTTLEEKGLAEADLKESVLSLPVGVQLSPSAAGSLQTCSDAQIGFIRNNPTSGTSEFNSEPAACPAASKFGTVKIKTPVLEHELSGSVYLAAEGENPFNSRFGMYIVIEDNKTGVLVKIPGKVSLDPNTGQVTTTFENAPQLPFEELSLTLFGGPRAPLATPRTCGTFSSTASFKSWAEPGANVGPEEAGSALAFPITSGVGGGACPGTAAFEPTFQAGTSNTQAGEYTPFTLNISEPEANQALTNVEMTLPEGLSGVLKNVTQCAEAQANAGTCGEGSLIGSASAVTGLGPDPFTVTGGRVYITEKYDGAPFGLSIVIPAVAGPFNFGNVVTRAQIFVNSSTAALKIISGVPTMVDTVEPEGSPLPPQDVGPTGVPVDLRQLDVTVERPGGAPFQFNPTNCTAMEITGKLSGSEGASKSVSQHFQATGCEKLPFTPELTTQANSKWTRLDGTNLTVVVTSSPGQANIAKTKIVFPEQLPSRLTTIQKACPEKTFETNPATCDEGSIIGTGEVTTPLLNSKLVGPAYLVSHGGAEFPDVEFVLQGEGITLVLDGQTNIHHGVTSSTFNSVPDAPVTTFVATLPAGPHSAFTGYGNLCEPTTTVFKTVTVTKKVGKKTRRVKKRVETQVPVAGGLTIPTILTGQNGDVIEKSTKLELSGCPKIKGFKAEKPKPKAKKKTKKKKNGKRKK